MITTINTASKDFTNQSPFWRPSQSYIVFRKTNFIDTGKMLSVNVAFYDTTMDSQGNVSKVTTTVFANIDCYNEWVSSAEYLQNKEAGSAYNQQCEITSQTVVVEQA